MDVLFVFDSCCLIPFFMPLIVMYRRKVQRKFTVAKSKYILNEVIEKIKRNKTLIGRIFFFGKLKINCV